MPNLKKLQTTNEKWLFKLFKDTMNRKHCGKGEIAHFEQFHLFPRCFPKGFLFNELNCVYMEEMLKPYNTSKLSLSRVQLAL